MYTISRGLIKTPDGLTPWSLRKCQAMIPASLPWFCAISYMWETQMRRNCELVTSVLFLETKYSNFRIWLNALHKWCILSFHKRTFVMKYIYRSFIFFNMKISNNCNFMYCLFHCQVWKHCYCYTVHIISLLCMCMAVCKSRVYPGYWLRCYFSL